MRTAVSSHRRCFPRPIITRTATLVTMCMLGLCFASGLLAQASGDVSTGRKEKKKPELPSGLLLSPVPEYSKWTIFFSYADDRKPADKPPGALPLGRPRQTTITKTRDLIREVVTDTAGKQSEIWFSGQDQYIKPPGDDTWHTSTSHAGALSVNLYHMEPLPPSGFRKLEWIMPRNYTGAIKYKREGTAFVFVPGGSNTLDLDRVADVKTLLEDQCVVACVDSETRLPLVVKIGDEIRVYSFGSPPDGMQVLPSDLAQQIQRGKEGRLRLGAPALQPY